MQTDLLTDTPLQSDPDPFFLEAPDVVPDPAARVAALTEARASLRRNAFTAGREARMAPVAADRTAPVRVADLFDLETVRRRCRPDPRTTAALPAPLRRVLTLAAEHPAGLPVWALAGIAEWPESLVVAVGERLREEGLARVRVAEAGDAEVVPTDTGRAVAAVLYAWRMPHVG